MGETDITISNMALGRLGFEAITSFTEDSKHARACKQYYEQCRKMLIGSHAWRFAMKQKTLTQLSTAPDFGYSYQYQLPTDCLMPLWMVTDFTDQPEWRQFGQQIYTNATEVDLEYVSNVDAVENFDQHFVKALYLTMAAEMSYLLTKDRMLKVDLLQEVEMVVREAKRMNLIARSKGKYVKNMQRWNEVGR